MIRIPDIPTGATMDDVILHVNMSLGLINGYSTMGAPTRLTQYDNLLTDGTVSTDYGHQVGVTDDTTGLSWQAVYGPSQSEIVSADKAGFHGPLPWETTSTLKVGLTSWLVGNVGIGQAPAAFALGITGNTKATGTLWVTLTSQLDGNTGIGESPPGSFKLGVTGNTKATGTLWVTSTAQVDGNTGLGETPPGSFKLGVTGNSKLTGSLWVTTTTQLDGVVGIGEAPSTDALRVTGLTSVAGNIVPRTDNARDLGTSSLQWRNIYTEGLVADATTLVVDATNHKIGIGTATPDSVLDVNNMMRVMGQTTVPTTGKALELLYNPATDRGTVLSFNRAGGGAFTSLDINALDVRLMASSAITFEVITAGVRYYATGSGAGQVTSSLGASADATYGNTERDMLNVMWQWMEDAGIITP